MEAADGASGEFHRRADLRIERSLRSVEIRVRRGDLGGVDIDLVEFAGKVDQRLVAVARHLVDDRPHFGVVLRKVGFCAAEKPGALRF